MVNIIIPLIRSKWGLEIKYSILSWAKYFTSKHKITIIGDYKPDFIKNTNYIYFKQNKNSPEENTCAILNFVINNFEEFIWTNDDIYLLKEMDLEEIKVPYFLEDLSKITARNLNRWGKLLWKTADILTLKNKTIMNGETHTPYFYESKKIKLIFEEYGIKKGKGLLRTAYINNFYSLKEMKFIDKNKIGFYREKQIKKEDLQQGKFLNHDDNGLSNDLKTAIINLFETKN